MDRIGKLLEYIRTSGKDSFLQHALALEYIKIGRDTEARALFNEILLREPTYIGSYYHLAKLLERVGDTDRAIRVYERGMEEARKAGDTHTYNELQMAREEMDEE
jgi:Tfp pilus assembly protein PilF